MSPPPHSSLNTHTTNHRYPNNHQYHIPSWMISKIPHRPHVNHHHLFNTLHNRDSPPAASQSNQLPFNFLPLLGSALQASLIGLVSRTPPLILEAFSFHIQESSPPTSGSSSLLTPACYAITCQYGPYSWTVNRNEIEFVFLRARLPIAQIRNHRSLKELPSFPSLGGLKLSGLRSLAVKKYLTRLLTAINYTTLVHLADFLSFSTLSFQPTFRVKPLEMRVTLRVYTSGFLSFLGFKDFKRVHKKDVWLLISSTNACIVTMSAVDDPIPNNVFLLAGPNLIVDTVKFAVGRPRVHLKWGLSNERHISLTALSASDHDMLYDYCSNLALSGRFTNHPFSSSSPGRSNAHLEFLIDGEAYFSRVAEVMSKAKTSIYIMDWFLTPELYLKRPVGLPQTEFWRLDRLLQRKANEGVLIYIIIYKEISAALNISSYYAKFALMGLSPNIHVLRFPDISASSPMWYALHSKLIVIDDIIAFIGGIDLCLGRFDTHRHALFDPPVRRVSTPSLLDPSVRNQSPSSSQGLVTFPGQDFSNPTLKNGDFTSIYNTWGNDIIDRHSVPRLPWHDVSCLVVGNPDFARVFVHRWLHIQRNKNSFHKPIPPLLPPADIPPYIDLNHVKHVIGHQLVFNCPTQAICSQSQWSAGVPTESSILRAYEILISNAKSSIYIENQFFVSGEHTQNCIAEALINRIIKAHHENLPFHVIIILPLFPAFPGPVNSSGASTLRLVMGYQYESICRAPNSIVNRLKSLNVPFEKYIGFYGLRTWNQQPLSQDSNIKHPVLYPLTNDTFHTSPRDLLVTQKNDSNNPEIRSIADCINTDNEVGVPSDDLCVPSSEPIIPRPLLMTEQIYVHCKLLIVDDEVAIIGSANINDRSMMGDRDSELGVVIGPFPNCTTSPLRQLRLSLMQEHLGLIQDSSLVTNMINMASPECIQQWQSTARKNTKVFASVFHCIPNDSVKNYTQCKKYTSNAPSQDPVRIDECLTRLAEVSGHLVEFPLDFLCEEDLLDISLVRTLFRRILRLHRKFPLSELRFLGDKYAIEEFRRHKSIDNPSLISSFISEWESYCNELDAQLNKGEFKGKPLNPTNVDQMSNDQVQQLDSLRQTYKN